MEKEMSDAIHRELPGVNVSINPQVEMMQFRYEITTHIGLEQAWDTRQGQAMIEAHINMLRRKVEWDFGLTAERMANIESARKAGYRDAKRELAQKLDDQISKAAGIGTVHDNGLVAGFAKAREIAKNL